MLPYQIFENVEQARSYLKGKGIKETDNIYQQIRRLLKGKEGYVGWFTRIAYEDILPTVDSDEEVITEVSELIDKINQEKTIFNNLPKPIVEYPSYEALLDDYGKAVTEHKAKKMWSEFPATQKKLMNLKNKADNTILSKLYDDESNPVFLKKIAAYKDRKSLIDSIRRFINKTSTSFDEILMRLHQEGLPIIYVDEPNNIIIAKILDYNQCRKIASRTSWCIARSESTFRSYVPDTLHSQYVIYLTDKPDTDNDSIIGATFSMMGFRTAHGKSDNYVAYDRLMRILKDRGYDYNKLKFDKKLLTDDMIDGAFVKELKQNLEMSTEEILKRKSKFKFVDLEYLTREEIIANKVWDKIENLSAQPVKGLRKIAKMNTQEIIALKPAFKSDDILEFTKEEIERYGLLEKTEIHGNLLIEYTKEEIVRRKMLDRLADYSVKLDVLMKLGFDREEIQAIKDINKKLDHNDKGFYDKYLSRPKSSYKNYYEYRVGSTSGSGSDSYSLDGTMRRLLWYEVTPKDISLDYMGELLSKVSDYKLPEMKKFIDDMGYTYTEEELYKFFKKIYWGSVLSHPWDVDIQMMKLGYDRSTQLLNIIMSSSEVIDDSEVRDIREVLTGKRDKELQGFIEFNQRNLFVKETLGSGHFFWAKQRDSDNPGAYWTKWGNYGAMVDWNKLLGGGTYRYKYETLLSYITLATLTGNIQYLYNIKVDWEMQKGYRGWSDGTLLSRVVKLILGYLITNGKPTIGVEDQLKDVNDRRQLYQWVMNYIWPSITDKQFFKYDLQLLFFIFDKKKFYGYVDDVKKMKQNYTYRSDADKDVVVTRRYIELKPTFEYLLVGHYYDVSYYHVMNKIDVVAEFRNVLTYFLKDLQMGSKERMITIKGLINTGSSISGKDIRTNCNKVLEDLFNVEIVHSYNDDITIREKQPIKESVITDYTRFTTVR